MRVKSGEHFPQDINLERFLTSCSKKSESSKVLCVSLRDSDRHRKFPIKRHKETNTTIMLFRCVSKFGKIRGFTEETFGKTPIEKQRLQTTKSKPSSKNNQKEQVERFSIFHFPISEKQTEKNTSKEQEGLDGRH